jgi:teichuronic acid exporter
MDNIANQTVSTTMWATVEKISTMGIQFVISMLLARLLSPADYGAIAMLMIFMAIGQQFIECGFSNALIRKQDCTQIDYSTSFIFNIVVGVVAYFLLFIIAPIVGRFYKMPILIDVLRVYGFVLILNSFTIVQNAILTKNLNFKIMAKVNTLNSLVSGIAGLVCAFYGMGVWALVCQSVIGAFFSAIFMSYVTKWRPSAIFSNTSFRYLWGFGSKMLVTGLISVIYGNIYSLVIGKIYDSKALGLFNRGQNTAQLFPNIVGSVFGRSTLPLLSQVQNDKTRLTYVYRQFAIVGSFLNFPLVFLIMALASPFILFFLTDKWAGAIIYVQIFAISMLTSAAGSVNLNLLQAMGRSDYTLRAEVIKKGLGFITVAALFNFGPLVLAVGSSIFNILCYFINLYYARKVLGISYMVQLKDLSPYFITSFLMFIFVYFFTAIVPSNLLKLVLGTFIGGLVYFLITKYILKVPYYNKIFEMVKQKCNK